MIFDGDQDAIMELETSMKGAPPILTSIPIKTPLRFDSDEISNEFKGYSNENQLALLTSLLKVSSPEVKYNFKLLIEEITMFDIISEIPGEISERILLMLDLSTLLKCRLVCHSWNIIVSQCNKLWFPFIHRNGIDASGFSIKNDHLNLNNDICFTDKNQDVIGEGMRFDFNALRTEVSNIECHTIFSDSYFIKYVKGRKVIQHLQSQAGFHHIIDRDCCGSNLVMAMNEEIIAYAREDRHIVVKFADFPHKKICVFEAHQVADMKILNDKLITGGFNRTICIWFWESGQQYCCLEGSLKPVHSVDVRDELLVSSDGKSIITWDLLRQEMLVKWPCFDDDGIVEELVIVDPKKCSALEEKYTDYLLVTRSYHELKIWNLKKDGTLTFLSLLSYNKEIHHYQPFIKVKEHILACSSEYGILMWNLLDFSFISQTERKPCKTCQFTCDYCRHTRVLLLHYSWSHVLEYYVHGNCFNLLCLTSNEKVNYTWNYPSDEKWPWAYRKPGMACIVSNLDNGFTENTKIIMFVATQHRKIYCMIFDASDLDDSTEYQISKVLLGSRTWNSLIS